MLNKNTNRIFHSPDGNTGFYNIVTGIKKPRLNKMGFLISLTNTQGTLHITIEGTERSVVYTASEYTDNEGYTGDHTFSQGINPTVTGS